MSLKLEVNIDYSRASGIIKVEPNIRSLGRSVFPDAQILMCDLRQS